MQQRYPYVADEFAGAQHLAAGQQVADRDLAAGAAGTGDDQVGFEGGEHGEGVAGGGGGDDVAAEGARVADLWGAGRARRGGQARDEGGEVGAAHPREGQSGAEEGVAVLVLPAADLADPAEPDQSGGPQQPGVDGGHQVRTARYGHGGGHGGERRHGLVERGRQRHG
ncbi:hypothetical protein SRIMM317S_01737 [Streptomyces rimosus subsp. rimosus]